jgi:hypothetical protein
MLDVKLLCHLSTRCARGVAAAAKNKHRNRSRCNAWPQGAHLIDRLGKNVLMQLGEEEDQCQTASQACHCKQPHILVIIVYSVG